MMCLREGEELLVACGPRDRHPPPHQTAQDTMSGFHLTEEDQRAIHELSKDPRIATRVFKSIGPSIFGHEHVKSCIALSLFGGVAKVCHTTSAYVLFYNGQGLLNMNSDDSFLFSSRQPLFSFL